MNSRNLIPTVVGIALVWAIAAPTRAAGAVDLAQYFMLTPGYWTVLEEGDGFGTTFGYGGTSVQALGSLLLQIQYQSDDGVAWQHDWIDVWGVDSQRLAYMGGVDMGSGDILLAQPPAVLPRMVDVGQPLFIAVKDIQRSTGTEVSKTGAVMVVTNTGVTQTTPAGTFNNCIETGFAGVRMDVPAGGAASADGALEVMAPGFGRVLARNGEVWREPGASGSYTDEETLVDFGTSNPPFPPLPTALRGILLEKTRAMH